MMGLNSFPLGQYLERVGLKALSPATAEGLRELVRAQSFAISFENLDVLAGIPVSLQPNAVVEKILRHGRGGYCYELNGLLGMALEAAGFHFTRRLSRVTYRRPEPGPKTHLVYAVKVDGEEWLVDVGFGGPGLVEPAPLRANAEFAQNGARFRLLEEKSGDLHLQREVEGKWENLYLISAEPVLPIDIEVVNHFVSTWERSPFRSMFMCVAPVGSGLLVIQGQDLVRLDADLRACDRRPIATLEELRDVMTAEFKVAVPHSILERAWSKVSAGAKPLP
jgi:N-hydroxyarylamine O-acetyltransferase